jgi:hypothetical protein
MSSERVAKFRQQYQARLTGWYNGYVHVLIVAATALAVLYLCIEHIQNVTLLEWMTVPVAFLMMNAFEWNLHKNIMHRPSQFKLLQVIYRYHMLNHHQYFTDEEMTFENHRDIRITVFPAYAVTIFVIIAVPFAVGLGFLISANVGWLFIAVVAVLALTYEFIHLCCHMEENWFVRNCPLINTARRHHTAHHNTRLMMECNMNVTFPVADWWFGTSDLERGLLGHLFNGYNTRYLKKGLRAAALLPGGARKTAAGNHAEQPAE